MQTKIPAGPYSAAISNSNLHASSESRNPNNVLLNCARRVGNNEGSVSTEIDLTDALKSIGLQPETGRILIPRDFHPLVQTLLNQFPRHHFSSKLKAPLSGEQEVAIATLQSMGVISKSVLEWALNTSISAGMNLHGGSAFAAARRSSSNALSDPATLTASDSQSGQPLRQATTRPQDNRKSGFSSQARTSSDVFSEQTRSFPAGTATPSGRTAGTSRPGGLPRDRNHSSTRLSEQATVFTGITAAGPSRPHRQEGAPQPGGLTAAPERVSTWKRIWRSDAMPQRLRGWYYLATLGAVTYWTAASLLKASTVLRKDPQADKWYVVAMLLGPMMLIYPAWRWYRADNIEARLRRSNEIANPQPAEVTDALKNKTFAEISDYRVGVLEKDLEIGVRQQNTDAQDGTRLSIPAQLRILAERINRLEAQQQGQ